MFVKREQYYNDFYYNKSVNPISPDFFKKFVFDGWGGAISMAGALPIKIVKSYKGDDFILLLVRTEHHVISDDTFKLPKLKLKYPPEPSNEEDQTSNGPSFKQRMVIVE